LEIAATQYPAEEMFAYYIAKDFQESIEPTKEFVYDKSVLPELTAA
jgi:hypothetical protein